MAWRGVAQALGMVQDRGGKVAQALGVVQGQPSSRVMQANSWLASEGWVYRMLMRGDSKAAEGFRSWIADEVVPTVRRAGKYDAEQSGCRIAQDVVFVARFYVKSSELAGAKPCRMSVEALYFHVK